MIYRGAVQSAMPRYEVILVEPRVEGNVGAVARAMANFGFRHLVLVNPPPLGEEAYRRARHARSLLERARSVIDLRDALDDSSLSVGTSAVATESEEEFHRQAIPPWDLAAELQSAEGQVALVLGREDYGLYNEELSQLDFLVHIPTSPRYPALNISHAATVLLYELSRPREQSRKPRRRLASGFEKEKLHEAFDEFLLATGYPSHKRLRTEVMFRRLVGRALPTKWEFHAMMGAFRGATKGFRRLTASGEDGSPARASVGP